MERKGLTKDGSVDLQGRLVVASETGRWKACYYLLGYEAFERMAFYGVATNLVNYLTNQLHENTVSSVRNVNTWAGSVWITPILGAYIADTYLGRFWTFAMSSLIYLLGMVLLTLAVSIKSLRPPCTDGVCEKATLQIILFYSALYVMAIGSGGTKPNISTFGADQFDELDSHEKELKVSFFNWWMFSSFFGALVASLGLVYIQENFGWGIGYGIPTVGLMVSLVIFYVGTPNYRHKVKNTKSPAKMMVQVWLRAFANHGLKITEDLNQLYELEEQEYVGTGKRPLQHTSGFRFLDKAALKQSKKPCTVTQVEEAKLILGMVIVWLTTLIPSTIAAQVNTLFVKQGTTLDRAIGRHFEIPSASLISFVTLSMLLSVPIYDRIFVPYMRKRTGNPRGITLLKRLGTGFSFQVLVALVACLVERKRMNAIRENHIIGPKETIPMSIFWLMPQYVLLGIGDVFNSIALLEFFYDQSPDDMRSLGTTFFTSGIAAGNFLNSFLVTTVDKLTRRGGRKSWIGDNLNDSHLDYYYAFLMVLSVMNLMAFFWVSRGYNYKQEILDVLDEKVLSVQMEEKRIDC